MPRYNPLPGDRIPNTDIILVEEYTINRYYRGESSALRMGRFKCFCGNEFKTNLTNVRNKITSSCGCIRKKKNNHMRNREQLSIEKVRSRKEQVTLALNLYEEIKDELDAAIKRKRVKEVLLIKVTNIHAELYGHPKRQPCVNCVQTWKNWFNDIRKAWDRRYELKVYNRAEEEKIELEKQRVLSRVGKTYGKDLSGEILVKKEDNQLDLIDAINEAENSLPPPYEDTHSDPLAKSKGLSPEEDSMGLNVEDEIDLNSLKYPELRKIAKEMQMKNIPKKKVDLIKRIEVGEILEV